MFPRVSRYSRLTCAACAPAPSCIAWIKSHLGATICTDYGSSLTMVIASRKKKECVAVLTGLLCGGHVDLASSFVNGTPSPPTSASSTAWDNRCGVTWPGAPGSPEDADMREDIRGCNWKRHSRLLCSSDTPVESVKWIVGWLGMRQPWELRPIAEAAIVSGNVQVTRWLFGEFRLGHVLGGFADLCALSKNPVMLKLWLETFPSPPENDKKFLLSTLVCNEFSSVELCQWVQKRLEIPSKNCDGLYLDLPCNPQCLKWACEEFSIPPNTAMLYHISRHCRYPLEVVKWLVKEKSVKPTWEACLCACNCMTDNVELVKWLAKRVALSPPHYRELLVRALACSNTRIADWLEGTFHVLRVVNTPAAADSLFCDVLCRVSCDSSLNGVKWLLQHVDVNRIPQKAAKEGILATWNMDAIFFILKATFLSRTTQKFGAIPLTQLCSITLFMMCTNMDSATSSKNVKWLVSQLGVDSIRKLGIHTRILDGQIDRDKPHCLIWLIEMFGLQLCQILEVPLPWNIGLNTWKLVINKFSPGPEEVRLEKDNVFMKVATSLPCIAEWSIARFSLSHNEVTQYIRDSTYVPHLMKLWLSNLP
ncbi:hypothetical protein Pelo_18007 [Pelomyxa schiedti]|nr:hypothetical protein Pelo_18007 [Pelomyxa schiedti]